MDFKLSLQAQNNMRKDAILIIDGTIYRGNFTYDYPCFKCDLKHNCTDKINKLCEFIDMVRISHEDTRSLYWILNKEPLN